MAPGNGPFERIPTTRRWTTTSFYDLTSSPTKVLQSSRPPTPVVTHDAPVTLLMVNKWIHTHGRGVLSFWTFWLVETKFTSRGPSRPFHNVPNKHTYLLRLDRASDFCPPPSPTRYLGRETYLCEVASIPFRIVRRKCHSCRLFFTKIVKSERL